jgi:hypothetical protein
MYDIKFRMAVRKLLHVKCFLLSRETDLREAESYILYQVQDGSSEAASHKMLVPEQRRMETDMREAETSSILQNNTEINLERAEPDS